MKKHFRTILLFLLLGAILNVAVAWGCVLAFDPFDLRDNSYSAGHQSGLFRFGDSILTVKRRHSSVFLYVDIDCFNDDARPSPQVIANCMRGKLDPIYDEAAKERAKDLYSYARISAWRNVHLALGTGWPMKSMWFEYEPFYFLFGSRQCSGGFEVKNYPQWIVGRKTTIPRVLPLRITPNYLIFNTLFYAVLLWLPYQGFFTLRRHRRIRRGRCGQCGYIVAPNIGVPGASPNCPECGTPITQKIIQPSAIILEETDHES